jgi:hypothetical protein
MFSHLSYDTPGIFLKNWLIGAIFPAITICGSNSIFAFRKKCADLLINHGGEAVGVPNITNTPAWRMVIIRSSQLKSTYLLSVQLDHEFCQPDNIKSSFDINWASIFQRSRPLFRIIVNAEIKHSYSL